MPAHLSPARRATTADRRMVPFVAGMPMLIMEDISAILLDSRHLSPANSDNIGQNKQEDESAQLMRSIRLYPVHPHPIVTPERKSCTPADALFRAMLQTNRLACAGTALSSTAQQSSHAARPPSRVVQL